MLVFITGAAGFIGRSVIAELLAHNHSVLGLARSDASAEALTAAGATPHRGELTDLDSLRSGAAKADGVIHLAFEADFSRFAECCAMDRAAIQAMGEAMAGTGKPLVIASGTLGLPMGKLATEDDDTNRNMPPFSDRALSADLVRELSAQHNIRGSVVRLSPTVHGEGDKGFVPTFVAMARKNGAASYVGDGSARWPTVHRHDAAALFRLALEKGHAGATYHAVGEEGVAIKDIMGLIGQELGVPVEGAEQDVVVERMGFFGHVIAMDNATSSQKTQEELGWKPVQPGLLEDMKTHYFKPEATSKFA